MIGKALKYSYINAKVRAIKSRFLTSEDYHILISTKNLEELLTYLRTTIYGEGMPEVSSPKELTIYLYRYLHEIILNVALEYNVDLIIMVRLGKKGARRILTGSVTERVIEFSKVPVLVIT